MAWMGRVGEGVLLVGNGWGVGLCGGEGGGSGGGSFHGGAGPVADAAVVDGAGVVGDDVAPCAGYDLLEVPCDPHDSPGGAHCGAGVQWQGEP